MRYPFRQGFVLTAIAGACVLAIPSTAMAAATTSPEAIGLYASGTGLLPITVANTPDETSVGTLTTASVSVPGILSTGVLTATVTSDNYSNTDVAGLSALGTLFPVLSSGTIDSFCVFSGAGNFSNSYVTIENLDILGATFTGTATPNENLAGITLPAGLGSITVTLDQQVTGPVAGSETINAVNIAYTLLGGLTTEHIVIASSTCGPFNASEVTPLASGKGLGIGLGGLALIGGVYATIRVRRRRLAMI